MPTITVPVELRFSDFDQFNHINNVAYFELMETARVEYMRTQARSMFGSIVLAHSACDYKTEVRGGTRTLDIRMSVERIGTSSFTLLYEIYSGEVLSALGRSVQVVLDDERRTRPITDEERAILMA